MYDKKTWSDSEVIERFELQNIEDGIDTVHTTVDAHVADATQHLTSVQNDAVDNSNAPSSGNPFATVVDISIEAPADHASSHVTGDSDAIQSATTVQDGLMTASWATKLNNIEHNADVTDTTNVTSAGAFMDSEFPTQSFTNLLQNGDFESWSAGTTSKPDGWTGGLGSIARNSSPKYNTYCLALTRSGSQTYLFHPIANYSDYLETVISFGAWVKASTVNQGYLLIETGAANITSSYHTGSGDWEFLIASGTLPVGATKLNLHCRVVNTDGIVYFDGAILVEGSVCPAFSPKPISKTDLVFRDITSVNTNTTLTYAHYTINVDAVGGARTITLPAAANNTGRVYNIKKIDSSGNTVTIDGNAAETIDGATTKVISTQWDSYTIQCNGTGWFII